MVFDSGVGVKEGYRVVVLIEERFHRAKRDGAEFSTTRADVLALRGSGQAGSEHEERASALSGRNDSLRVANEPLVGFMCLGGYNPGNICPSQRVQNLGRTRFSRKLARAAWAKCIAPA